MPGPCTTSLRRGERWLAGWPRHVLAILFTLLVVGCSELPALEGRSVSVADASTGDTRLGMAVGRLAQQHPGLTGILPLTQGHDAFAARATLADAAERSLDIQYYIWHDDLSGSMLFDAVRRAADRGVRVRLLLDDNNTKGLDPVLRALDAHPHIEVRLFNPFMHRSWRALDFLTDFSRVNRRMHNKSFTADNQVTVVGGRNIGDEYFAAGADVLFVDLDVLAVGAVVAEVSHDFDRYWASASAYPADRVLPRDPVEPAHRSGVALAGEDAARSYREAIASSPFVRELLAQQLPLEWATTHMVSDDPAKGLGASAKEDMLPARLRAVLGGAPEHRLDLVSPYFVPTEQGTEALGALARSGVHVTVLTNALEATDVAAVHAGYARWRKPLLEAGVHLYELRRGEAVAPGSEDGHDKGSGAGSGGVGGSMGRSAGSSLHAKTFAVDRQRVFVGSFNFDPRSARLNTELGFVIDSPALAARLADRLNEGLSQRAYELRLQGGQLQWIEQGESGTRTYDEDPNTSTWRRFKVWFMSLLPIDELL